MRVGTARSIVIFGSIASIALLVTLLLIGAATTLLPMEMSSAANILKICLPPFFGYMGSASLYITKGEIKDDDKVVAYLGPLLVGSLALFLIISLSGLIAFFVINSPLLTAAKLNPNRMSANDLENVFTVAVSMLTLTTGVITAFIFSVKGST